MQITLFLLHSALFVEQYSVSEWKDKEKENTILFLTFSQFQHLPLLYIYGIIQCDVQQELEGFSHSPLEMWTTSPDYKNFGSAGIICRQRN